MRAASILIGLAIFCATAMANGPLTLPSSAGANAGAVMRWDLSSLSGGAIPYLVNSTKPAGSTPTLPAGTGELDLVSVVRSAFQAWEDVPGSRIKYAYQGTTTRTNGLDGFNVVTFSPQGFTFPPGFPGGIFPLCTTSIAPGPVMMPNGQNLTANFAGQILDCDVVVNPQGNFTIAETGHVTGLFDLVGILVHEIGHFSGLDHSGVANSVMYGFYTLGQGYYNRAPKEDDIAGLSNLYPTEDFLSSTGQIRGTVVAPAGNAIFGAQVVAVDTLTGMVAGSAITGVEQTAMDGAPSKFNVGSGNYVIAGLPPGSYALVAESLDGPSQMFMSGVFGNGAGGLSFINTDFLTTIVNQPVTVEAAQSIAQTISVGARTATSPNLGSAPFGAAAGSSFTSPALIRTGELSSFSLSGNVNLAGASLAISGSGVASSQVSIGPTLSMSITADAAAPTGPRLLSATTPSGSAVLTGGITVMPQPLNFAQFANGENNVSTTIVVNPSSTVTATARLEFSDDRGAAVKSGLQTPSPGPGIQRTSLDVVVAPLGSASIRSDGSGSLVSGSATLKSNHPVGGIIKFGLPGLGIAGVEHSKPVSGFITPVRRVGNINTGVAIRNLLTRDAVLTLTLRDSQGATVSSGTVGRTIVANGHLAAFISELFPNAPLQTFAGTLTVTGSAGTLISGTALELGLLAGEFTTLPVTEVRDFPGTNTLHFAQFANGAGIASDLVITNPSASATLNARVEFFDDGGNPLTTGIIGVGARSSIDFTVRPLGSITFSSDGLGSVVAGSARVTIDRSAGGVVRFSLPGLGIAGVGSSDAVNNGFIIPVRTVRSEGTDTGVALVNAGDTPVDVLLILRDTSGVAALTRTLSLIPARGHLARFTRELFPGLSAEAFEGTLSVIIQTPGGRIAGTALDLGSTAGQFTSLPVVQLR
jgi:hypothetical protein